MGRALAVGFILLAAWSLGRAEGDGFEERVQPVLDEYCLSCHTGRRAKAKFDLSRPLNREAWVKVRRRLVRRDMPPEDTDRPDDAAYRDMIAWIDEKFGTGRPDPGRVTIRRLNRVEYRNTVRDLLGVDFDTAESFPADDVGHGFDNIGDVLSLPPILMEKYLAAAEAIAARAIVDEEPGNPPARRVTADALGIEGNGRLQLTGAWLYSGGAITTRHRFPRDGEYVLRARAWGQQAGPDVVKIAFRVGRRTVRTVDVPAVTPTNYEVRTRVKRGEHVFAVVFTNDYYQPRHPDPKQRDRNMGVQWLEVVGPVDPAPISARQRRLIPDPAPPLRAILGPLAERAWRRPLREGELDRLLALVARTAPKGASIERQVRFALTALLVSPHFLFRIELDPEAASAAWRVGDHELASRLSYFLWSSMPDDELFAAAGRGELQRDDVLEAQVRRMLASPRASALARNFATQWLQIRSLAEAGPRTMDVSLKAAMRTETEMFFDAVLRDNRSVWDFIDGDFTFLNERLARHYGIDGVRGPKMRRVRLDGKRRAGVITHASVLTMTSNPTRTSPVKRGKWILETLLDAPPPPPPPGVGALDEAPAAIKGKTMRERLAQHRADPNCRSCHVRMDVLGFGLENFDAVGRWRESDGDVRIDVGGKLPDGRTFNDPAGLRAILRSDRAFLRSLAKHLLAYALGRGLDDEGDEQAVAHLVGTLEAEPKLGRLVLEIVRLDAFRTKRADKVGPKR